MNRFTPAVCFSLFVLVLLSPVASSEPAPQRSSPKALAIEDSFSKVSPKVEVVADQLEYSRNQKKVTARKNVVIRYKDTQMTADYAEVETDTKKAYAKGHVIVFQNNEPKAQGTEAHFDFANDTGNFLEARAIDLPWYATGKEMEQIRRGVKVIHDGTVTTCDREEPHYAITAKKITVYDGDKTVAQNVTLRILGKPVFWWPYLELPKNEDPIVVNVGYNSRYGAFIELTKGISISKDIGAKAHLDWRSKRGFGGGADMDYHFGKEGKVARGIVKGYVTQDHLKPTLGLRIPHDRTRGRITWVHRTDLDPYSNIMLRYNRLADEFFLQDFFQHEYRADTQPQSFVTLTKNSERYGFLTHVERHMNSFEVLVEKLPEVRFDWKNQPFLKPWLFYESSTSFANLTKRIGRLPIRNEEAIRYDTFHEWSRPLNWHEIKFTPFVNWRGTYYTRRDRESEPDLFRTVFGGGVDLRTQFYRTYAASMDKWGIAINQIRHVFEPSIQYRSFKPTLNPGRLTYFDSVDRIDDADSVTFGMENRFQTKRVVQGRMKRVDLVSLNTFVSMEWRQNSGAIKSNLTTTDEGRTDGNFVSDTTVLNQEIVVRPYEWLQYQMRFDYDLRHSRFQAFNQDIVTRTRRFQFLFGHRYILDLGPFVGGDNQFIFEGKWVLNSLWSFGGYFRWDPDNSGRDEWQVSATRDLHDFLLDFGYNVRQSHVTASSGKELFFTFRLKAFPKIFVHAGQRAGFSEPRLGDTVAGANQTSLQGPNLSPFQEAAGSGSYS